MNLLRFSSVLHNPRLLVLVAGSAFLFWFSGLASGASELSVGPDIIIGIQDQSSNSAQGVIASYTVTDELNGSADITLFVAENIAARGEIRLAISGDDSRPVFMDDQPRQDILNPQSSGLTEDFEITYRLWDLGSAIRSSDWNYSFVYNGVNYYGVTGSFTEEIGEGGWEVGRVFPRERHIGIYSRAGTDC